MFLRADHATDGPCGAMRYNLVLNGDDLDKAIDAAIAKETA